MIAELQQVFTKAVEKAAASTVSIGTPAGFGGPPFGPYVRRGHGSGVVLDREGHILTNQHVVARAEKIVVTLADGQVLAGTVVGSDEDTDIGVVRVAGQGLVPAEFGDSDALKVGQPVLAIGNPLGLAGGPTVTSGIISSLRRNLQRGPGDGLTMVQTDAAVNPGSSGGPLVDLDGQVVAITSAMIPYAESIGFAIPSNSALRIAKEIIRHGRVQRPWLGIVGHDMDRRIAYYRGLPQIHGVFVVEITEGGPAAAAGLRVGDVLVAAEKEPLVGMGDLIEALKSKRPGDEVVLEVDRSGTRLSLRVQLGPRPF